MRIPALASHAINIALAFAVAISSSLVFVVLQILVIVLPAAFIAAITYVVYSGPYYRSGNESPLFNGPGDPLTTNAQYLVLVGLVLSIISAYKSIRVFRAFFARIRLGYQT